MQPHQGSGAKSTRRDFACCPGREMAVAPSSVELFLLNRSESIRRMAKWGGRDKGIPDRDFRIATGVHRGQQRLQFESYCSIRRNYKPRGGGPETANRRGQDSLAHMM